MIAVFVGTATVLNRNCASRVPSCAGNCDLATMGRSLRQWPPSPGNGTRLMKSCSLVATRAERLGVRLAKRRGRGRDGVGSALLAIELGAPATRCRGRRCACLGALRGPRTDVRDGKAVGEARVVGIAGDAAEVMSERAVAAKGRREVRVHQSHARRARIGGLL